jgi:hypothetical protein
MHDGALEVACISEKIEQLAKISAYRSALVFHVLNFSLKLTTVVPC